MRITAKPVMKEAFLFEDGKQIDELAQDVIDNRVLYTDEGTVLVKTLEGYLIAKSGDYIIRGLEGELHPCKPDIFKASYDTAPESTIRTFAFESDMTWWLLVYDKKSKKFWNWSNWDNCWYLIDSSLRHRQVKPNEVFGKMYHYMLTMFVAFSQIPMTYNEAQEKKRNEKISQES